MSDTTITQADVEALREYDLPLGVKDALGVEVRTGDAVTVLNYGWNVTLSDCGTRFVATGLNKAGNLTHDTDRFRGRGVRAAQVAVARRDGQPGHEGNRSAR